MVNLEDRQSLPYLQATISETLRTSAIGIIYYISVYHKLKYMSIFHNIYINAITKTRLYNFDPLKPHFYIVKLGFTGVYIIFLLLLKNIGCGYSLEPPRRGGSNEYSQSMF